MFFAPNTPSFPDRAETVTTSDSTTFNASAIVALVGGDIKVQPAGGGSPVVFSGWPAFVPLPVMCTKVWAAGTTATGIIRTY